MSRITAYLLIIFFMGFLISSTSALPITFCLPTNGSLYFGAFPQDSISDSESEVTEHSIELFTRASGKKPAIIAFSQEWGENKNFPLDKVKLIKDYQAIPYILLMLRSSDSEYVSEPLYTFDNILNGKFDNYFRSWAREARSLGTPVIVEYGTEVNGWWYPWNGYWNGQNGSGSFQEAYRHIIQIMKEEGADNLIWVFHVNAESVPLEEWNNISEYYPGDEYIDWIGITANGAPSPFSTSGRSFKELIDGVYSNIFAFSSNKPIIISEFGTDMRNPVIDPSSWTRNALEELGSKKWPSIIGAIWWNKAWKNDNEPLHDSSYRIEDNDQVSDIFHGLLGDDAVFLDRMVCP